METLTNLSRLRIDLRDRNAKTFSDIELSAWLIDNKLIPGDEYKQDNKKGLMLSVRDALRQLLRDWDSAKTVSKNDFTEGYSKGAIMKEIDEITATYEWCLTNSEMVPDA